MVKMENIRKHENIISVDCYAEGQKTEYFYLEIDVNTFEIITNSHNKMDAYVFHALQRIKDCILTGEELSESMISMWY